MSNQPFVNRCKHRFIGIYFFQLIFIRKHLHDENLRNRVIVSTKVALSVNNIPRSSTRDNLSTSLSLSNSKEKH